jgi:hypothetical protein
MGSIPRTQMIARHLGIAPSICLESASRSACKAKGAETVRSEDFRGIQRLARRLGDQLVAGAGLYAGGQPLPFGDRLRAWPMSALWTVAPDVS